MKEPPTGASEKCSQGYIGWVAELPGATTQGKTLEDRKVDLMEATLFILRANRELAEVQMDAGNRDTEESSGGETSYDRQF